jgi:DNA primase
MTNIATILNDISTRYGLKKGNGRYSGPCPECGGSKSSDKFVIKLDGGYKCYSCDFKGDIITWLRNKEGKTCPDAHEEAGIPCRSDGCSVRGTCRLGDGSGKRPVQQRRSVSPPLRKEDKTITVTSLRSPQALWQSWAASIVAKSNLSLAGSLDIIAWLSSRGIDSASCDRFRLGWLDHDIRVTRSANGLPPKEGKDKIWIPGGLVIPTFSADGSIHRLRIRRTEKSREKFLPDLKYVWIEGSGTSPMIIKPDGSPRGVVIVEAELDGLAISSAHPQVMVISLGTVSAGLPKSIIDQVATAPVVLISLDADQDENGKPGSGPKAIKTWLKTFRQARFWPVPKGKDPGEYAQNGGNLRTWIEAGLPPQSVSAPINPVQDEPFSPESLQQGEEGGENTLSVPLFYVITLKNGREIHVTNDKSTWDDLVGAGKVVFSKNELCRLQESCSKMTTYQRQDAIQRILEVKETFSGAYIRSGQAFINSVDQSFPDLQ